MDDPARTRYGRARPAPPSQDVPPERADHRQLIEPRRGVGARGIARIAFARIAARDLVEITGLAAVVFPTRYAQVLVDRDVDRAHAEAGQLGRGGLRRDDPDVARPGHEQELDEAVARDDAKSPHESTVERALERRGFEHAAREVGLEAAREAQRPRIARAREGRDRTSAVDEVA